MNFLTTISACPYCYEAKMAVLLANPTMPLGERIDMINLRYGDSRIKMVQKNKDGSYSMPQLILEKHVLRRRFNTTRIERGERKLLTSSTYTPYMLSMIRMLHDNYINLI